MNSKDEGEKRNSHLFQHLVAMFQTLALQQLGKLINPITGKLERELQQARITIDMLQMIKEKTTGNLSIDEQRLIDSVVMELQMNFIDELQRGEEPEAREEPARESAVQEEPVREAERQSEAPAAESTEMRSEEKEATEEKKKKTARAKRTSKKSVKKRKKERDS